MFGKVDFGGAASDCVYPLKVLRYASADVLLVQAGEPGEGCHGCAALLSAYVIQRIGGFNGQAVEFVPVGGRNSTVERRQTLVCADGRLGRIERAGASEARMRRSGSAPGRLRHLARARG